jgi:hypothetical protein
MANNFAWDADCVALWRFENGALTTDSIGGNTLTASASSPTADTSNYKEGGASADFETSSTQYFSIADASLDAGFPLKNGDSVKKISVCCWFKAESLVTSHLFSKYDSTNNKRSWTICYSTTPNKICQYFGYNSGVSGERKDAVAISTGRFYHLGVAVDGVAKTSLLRIWDDTSGEIVYSNQISFSNALNVEDAEVCIGDKADHNEHWDGLIDEMPVFKRLLTTAEMDEIRLGVFGCPKEMASTTMIDAAAWATADALYRPFLIF